MATTQDIRSVSIVDGSLYTVIDFGKNKQPVLPQKKS
jgi:hypothetical protein